MPPPPPAFAAAGSGSARRADASVPDPDLGVIKTNDEASGAKACCVSRGYFDDPFVKHFARRVPKHPPLINRGYHARVATVRAVLDAFLDATFDADRAEDGLGASSPATSPGDDRVASSHENRGKRRQIVSLGAGFDTSYFRLRTTRRREDDVNQKPPCSLTFVEIDHASVVAEKAAIVNARPELREACVGGDGVRRMGGDEDGLVKEKKNASASASASASRSFSSFADGGGYVMCGCDLRDARALDAALSETARLDPNVPTLFLSECCLAYLEAEEASEVLRWAASWGGGEGEGTSFEPLRAYFAYDPSLIGDATKRDRFGEQMLLNLRARGCPLLGAEETKGVAAHAERARRCGWRVAGAADMLAASSLLTSENPSESRRVACIEPLDELEEYGLIQAHYVVSWGVRGADDDAARLERVVDRSARRPR